MVTFTKSSSPYKRIVPASAALAVPEEVKLFKFQEELIRKMLDKYHNGSKGVLNACDQGLGKTLMTIVLANTAKEPRIVIVCKAGLRANWENEIRKFDRALTPIIRTIYGSKDAYNRGTFRWMITSYSLLNSSAVRKAIGKFKPTFSVFDESQELSGMRTERTERCRQLSAYTRNSMFVSGTPIRTGIMDIFPTLNMINKDLFPDYHQFANLYAQERVNPFTKVVEYYGGKNLSELSKIMHEHLFVRMTKQEALPELPPKTFQEIELDCENVAPPFSPQEIRRIMSAIDRGEDIAQFTKKPKVAKLRQELGIAKLKAGKYFIKDLLDDGIPIIVAAYHHSVLNGLSLGFKDYNPLLLTGKTPARQRQILVDQFNSGQSNLFALQIEAGGAGLNLQKRCSTVVVLEPPFSPADLNQLVDRTHRIGQKNAVNVYMMLARNSYDQTIMRIILRKLTIINKAIKSTEENDTNSKCS